MAIRVPVSQNRVREAAMPGASMPADTSRAQGMAAIGGAVVQAGKMLGDIYLREMEMSNQSMVNDSYAKLQESAASVRRKMSSLKHEEALKYEWDKDLSDQYNSIYANLENDRQRQEFAKMGGRILSQATADIQDYQAVQVREVYKRDKDLADNADLLELQNGVASGNMPDDRRTEIYKSVAQRSFAYGAVAGLSKEDVEAQTMAKMSELNASTVVELSRNGNYRKAEEFMKKPGVILTPEDQVKLRPILYAAESEAIVKETVADVYMPRMLKTDAELIDGVNKSNIREDLKPKAIDQLMRVRAQEVHRDAAEADAQADGITKRMMSEPGYRPSEVQLAEIEQLNRDRAMNLRAAIARLDKSGTTELSGEDSMMMRMQWESDIVSSDPVIRKSALSRTIPELKSMGLKRVDLERIQNIQSGKDVPGAPSGQMDDAIEYIHGTSVSKVNPGDSNYAAVKLTIAKLNEFILANRKPGDPPVNIMAEAVRIKSNIDKNTGVASEYNTLKKLDEDIQMAFSAKLDDYRTSYYAARGTNDGPPPTSDQLLKEMMEAQFGRNEKKITQRAANAAGSMLQYFGF